MMLAKDNLSLAIAMYEVSDATKKLQGAEDRLRSLRARRETPIDASLLRLANQTLASANALVAMLQAVAARHE